MLPFKLFACYELAPAGWLVSLVLSIHQLVNVWVASFEGLFWMAWCVVVEPLVCTWEWHR